MRRSVIITGASSGIGAALALRYAKQGARLGLLGRDQDRLNAIAEKCGVLGASVRSAAIDVTAAEPMSDWLASFDRAGGVDVLIASAGVSSGLRPDNTPESPDAARRNFEVNVIGVLNTVHPLLPRMTDRGGGVIVIMSSVAAFVALPQMPSYSASKAAVLRYGLALRAAVAPHGVRVNVACPGYVVSPMTDQVQGPTPFLVGTDAAVTKILRGVDRNRAVIAFPWLFTTGMRLVGCLPNALQGFVLSKGKFRIASRD